MVDPVSFASQRAVATSAAAPVAASTKTTDAARKLVASSSPPAASSPSLPKLMRMAAEIASQGPPVDYARLAPIRQAIAMGSYRIDPQAIAQALIA